MISFITFIKNTFYSPQDHMGFKDPATALMENIIELHHFIFFFILLISGLVLWLLIQIIDNFIYLYNFNININLKNHLDLNKFLIYIYGRLAIKTHYLRKINI